MSDSLAPGTLIDGRYRIIGAPLGSGGMGTIYLAEQLVIDRKVAIKVLRREVSSDPRAIKRFRREVGAYSKLSHPNIATVHDFGQLPNASLYLVLEFIDGRTLMNLLAEQGQLSPDRAVHIAAQVLDALEDAHASGIVHRDLKPENILLTHHAGNVDFVKVLDFGLASVQGLEALTRTGEIFGTPIYLSPEQAQGKRVDHRADLYGLGVILYEMMTHRPPFAARSSMALLVAHLNEAPPPFSESAPKLVLPPGLEAVVHRALAKEPADRFQSCAEMRDALQIALRGTPAPVSATRGLQTLELGQADTPPAEAVGEPTDPSFAEAATISPQVGLSLDGNLRDSTIIWPNTRARNKKALYGGLFLALIMLVAGGMTLLDHDPEHLAQTDAGPATSRVIDAAPATAPPTPTPTPKSKPDASAPTPALVTLTLIAEPAGASLAIAVSTPGTADTPSRSAVTTAVAPTTIEVPRGATVTATFGLKGHTPHKRSWVLHEDLSYRAQLVALPVKPPIKPRTKPSTKPSNSRRKPPSTRPRGAPKTPKAPKTSKARSLLDDLK